MKLKEKLSLLLKNKDPAINKKSPVKITLNGAFYILTIKLIMFLLLDLLAYVHFQITTSYANE